MEVERLVVGQLQTNCYLFYDQRTGQCLIIDPGDDADLIMHKIKELDLKPQAILATHGHFDHVLAITELKLAYNLPFYLHFKDLPILKRQQQTGQYFLGYPVDPFLLPDKDLKTIKTLKIAKNELKVIETPGHTQGSVSFYSSKSKLIFTGDLIFAQGGYGRTDLKGGDLKQLQKSISKILSLPQDTVIYPGHGEITTVKKEKPHHAEK